MYMVQCFEDKEKLAELDVSAVIKQVDVYYSLK